MTPKSHGAASPQEAPASEATALTQVHTGCECSREGGGNPYSSQGFTLSTENVDEDGDTLVWPPVFFGEVVRVAPYPADQRLPDPRVASAMAATVRQTPARLPR